MDIRWQGEISISAPYDLLYSYLADFPRHAEWAQTVDRLELVKPGDAQGVGAQYHTVERQGMQSNRAPFEPLTKGEIVETICEVRELCPSYRIVWSAASLRKPRRSADLSFDLTGTGPGSTRLLQRITLHSSKSYDVLDKLRNRTDPVILQAQLRAQWEAGLKNIKEIVETMAREQQLRVAVARETPELQMQARHV